MCVCLALLARMSTRLKIGSRYLKGSGFWSIRFDFCPIVCIVLCDTEIMIELMPVKPHNCNNRECIHYPTTTTYLKWVRAHLNNRTPHTQKYVMWKLWVPAWWMLMMKKATDWSCLHWHPNQFVILFKATWFRFWCVSIRLFLPTTHQLVTITPVRQITCLYSVRKRCSIPFIQCVCAFFTLSRDCFCCCCCCWPMYKNDQCDETRSRIMHKISVHGIFILSDSLWMVVGFVCFFR